MQAAARSAGVELRLVSTPAELLDQACSQVFDLVILDLTAVSCDPQQLVPWRSAFVEEFAERASITIATDSVAD